VILHKERLNSATTFLRKYMKTMIVLAALAALSASSVAFASSKICFGSTKNDETKGLVMIAEIDSQKVMLKTIKGQFYQGTYPALAKSINGKDGKTYLTYKGDDGGDYEEVILIDQALLTNGTTGLLQVRGRGEGFVNSVFVCKDRY
jgi:hypothetical protein